MSRKVDELANIKLNISELQMYFNTCGRMCDDVLKKSDTINPRDVTDLLDSCLERIENAKNFIRKHCYPSTSVNLSNVNGVVEHRRDKHLLLSSIKKENNLSSQLTDNGYTIVSDGKEASSCNDLENQHFIDRLKTGLKNAGLVAGNSPKHEIITKIENVTTIDSSTHVTALSNGNENPSIDSQLTVLPSDDENEDSDDSDLTILPSSPDKNPNQELRNRTTISPSLPEGENNWITSPVKESSNSASSVEDLMKTTSNLAAENVEITKSSKAQRKKERILSKSNISKEEVDGEIKLVDDSLSSLSSDDQEMSHHDSEGEVTIVKESDEGSINPDSNEELSSPVISSSKKKKMQQNSRIISSSSDEDSKPRRTPRRKVKMINSKAKCTLAADSTDGDKIDSSSSILSSSSSSSKSRSNSRKTRSSAGLTKRVSDRALMSKKQKFFEDSESPESSSYSESDVSADDEEVTAALKYDMAKRKRLMAQRAATDELLSRVRDSGDEEPDVTIPTSVMNLTKVDDLIQLTDEESVVLWPTIPKGVWHDLGHKVIPREVKFQELRDKDESNDSSSSMDDDDSVSRLTEMIKLNKGLHSRTRKNWKKPVSRTKRRRRSSTSEDSDIEKMQVTETEEESEESISDMSYENSSDDDVGISDEEEEAERRALMDTSCDSDDFEPEAKKFKKEDGKQKKSNDGKKKDRVVLEVPRFPQLESAKKRKRRRAKALGELRRRRSGLSQKNKNKENVTVIRCPSGDESSCKSLNSSNYSSAFEELSSDDDFQKSSAKKKIVISSNTSDDGSSIPSLQMGSKLEKFINHAETKQLQADEGSDDSDVNFLRRERIPSSQFRRNIRGILKQSDLSFETLHADSEQRNRKKRYKELQEKYNRFLVKDDNEEDKLKQLILQEDPLIEVAQKLAQCLRRHQAKAIQMLWFNLIENVDHIKSGDPGSGAMIAHYMGLGKTLTSIALMHTIFMHEEILNIRRFLIVVPKNVLENWSKEWQKWMRISEQRKPRIYTVHNYLARQRTSILDKWHSRGGILILSYHIMTNAFVAVYPELQKKASRKEISEEDKNTFKRCLIDPGPDIIFCDEAHVMKNDNTILFQGMSMIKTKRRAILTGTPMQNHLIEYHTMVSFIKPNYLGTQKEFKNRFANPIKNGQKRDSSSADVKMMKKRAYVLNRRLESIMDRKDDSYLLNDIPPKIHYVINVRLSDVQAELYSIYLSTIGMGGIEMMSVDEVDELMREQFMHRKILQHRYIFQYICCHPTLLKWQQRISSTKNHANTEVNSQRTEQERQACSQALSELSGANWWENLYEENRAYDPSVSNKLKLLFLIIDACSEIGDKVVIFSNSVLALELIERMLKKGKWPFQRRCTTYPEQWMKGRDYVVLTGKTASQDRLLMADRFNSENTPQLRLFLISIKAGGVGMNLFGANRVVILDPSWNPADENQACGRSWRLGQKKPTYVYRLLGAGTAEEQLYKRQVDKQTLSLRVVDEQQTDRHYTASELSAFYIFKHTEAPSEPSWAPPQDRLLADVMVAYPQCITSYHLHENMLLNRVEEKLTEEEYAEAWKEYEEESRRNELGHLNIPQPSTSAEPLIIPDEEIREELTEILPSMEYLLNPLGKRSSEGLMNISKSIPNQHLQLQRMINSRRKTTSTKLPSLDQNLRSIGQTENATPRYPTIKPRNEPSMKSVLAHSNTQVANYPVISSHWTMGGPVTSQLPNNGVGANHRDWRMHPHQLNAPFQSAPPTSLTTPSSSTFNSPSGLSNIGAIDNPSERRRSRINEISSSWRERAIKNALELSNDRLKADYPNQYDVRLTKVREENHRLSAAEQEEAACRQVREELLNYLCD